MWLLALTLACDPSTQTTDDTGEGATLDGAALFASNCARCHAADGTGGRGGPDLIDRAADMTVEDVEDVILNGSGRMRARDVTPAEAAAIADYVVFDLVGAAPLD